MNPGELSVRKNRVVFVAMLLILVGGFVAYQNMGRLEDPEFTIKEALIITPYPGASAEEVAKEVTNPIEIAVPAARPTSIASSRSRRAAGRWSRAVIKDRFTQGRDPAGVGRAASQDRRRAAQLPPSVRGTSMVVDDFGDVYGIFLAITGDGYSQPELRRYAEFLRRELLLVQRREEASSSSASSRKSSTSRSRGNGSRSSGSTRRRSTRQLQARNVAADGGRVRVGDEHIAIDPQGRVQLGRRDARPGDRLRPRRAGNSFLRDVATLERGDQDPPRRAAAVRRQAGHRPRHLDGRRAATS